MVTVVPRISDDSISSGWRSGAKTMRAGRSSRAHDEKPLMSNSAMGLPLSGSEERRVGKSVDLGGRRIIKKKKKHTKKNCSKQKKNEQKKPKKQIFITQT